MKSLVLLIGLIVILVGLVGVAAPSALMTVRRYAVTSVGLYVVAALRFGIGVALIKVAPDSRAPAVLRVFGIIALIAGLATALVGTDRARAMLEWESAQPRLVRFGAGFAVIFGGVIALAVAGRRAA